jgi:hypothetical protein
MHTLARWLTTIAWAGWGPATVIAVRPAIGIDVGSVFVLAAALAIVGVTLLWLGTVGMRR